MKILEELGRNDKSMEDGRSSEVEEQDAEGSTKRGKRAGGAGRRGSAKGMHEEQSTAPRAAAGPKVAPIYCCCPSPKWCIAGPALGVALRLRLYGIRGKRIWPDLVAATYNSTRARDGICPQRYLSATAMYVYTNSPAHLKQSFLYERAHARCICVSKHSYLVIIPCHNRSCQRTRTCTIGMLSLNPLLAINRSSCTSGNNGDSKGEVAASSRL
jgi:hypothetical protein